MSYENDILAVVREKRELREDGYDSRCRVWAAYAEE
jgi:hypothetical protein